MDSAQKERPQTLRQVSLLHPFRGKAHLLCGQVFIEAGVTFYISPTLSVGSQLPDEPVCVWKPNCPLEM